MKYTNNLTHANSKKQSVYWRVFRSNECTARLCWLNEMITVHGPMITQYKWPVKPFPFTQSNHRITVKSKIHTFSFQDVLSHLSNLVSDSKSLSLAMYGYVTSFTKILGFLKSRVGGFWAWAFMSYILLTNIICL